MATLNRKSEAQEYLNKSISSGFKDYVWLRLDVDVQNLSNELQFVKILNRNRQ